MASYDYDLIVIGAGAAGLTAAGVGANLGAKTLMIERDRLGGDCTWVGCVPSKSLLKAAKVAHHIRQASQFGLVDQEPAIDFAKVIRHVHEIREEVYQDADAPEIYRAMGVDVEHGAARFVDPHAIELEAEGGARRVTGRYFVIAAGGRAVAPPIDGLDGVPYLTNESLFEIEELPRRLAIIGGGPIGTEMAQAFRLLGADVTVIDRGGRILKKDDAEVAGILQETLARQGVRFVLNAKVERAMQQDGTIRVDVTAGGQAESLGADALLVAAGRRPNTDTLNLEAAGIAHTERGVTVDDRCRTNVRHIFAVGDVTGRYQFTHMSEHMAKVAVTNALVKVPMKIDARHVPWVTYTDPEVAHVGASEDELQRRGVRYQVYRFPYSKIDRAVAESEGEGLIKVYAKKLTGKILGASIAGTLAGELICEYAVAMKNGVTLRNIADTIHPYPTYLLGARRAADQWYIRSYNPLFVRVLQKVFGYRGPVLEPDPDRIV